MTGPSLAARAAGAASRMVGEALDAVRPDPPPTRVGGPLDEVNDGFHAGYDGARRDVELESPVLVLLGDALVVFHRGRREEQLAVPRFVHVIKSAAHAPVAAFALIEHRLRSKDDPSHGPLEKLRGHVVGALDALRDDEDAAHQPEARDDVQRVLSATLGFLDACRASGESGDPGGGDGEPLRARRDGFARQLGPQLLRLTEHATRIQLATLHEATERALAGFDRADLETLQIVVAGDHQARARSLGMQYFRKRLHEEGVDEEDGDERVAYGENVTSEAEALALVGRRRLDEVMARAFFGDPKRLQQDVLGDAAEKALAGMELGRIGGERQKR